MLSKMWNTFLDTTPRQWGRAAARVFIPQRRLLTWSAGTLTLGISLLVHAAILAAVAFGGRARMHSAADAYVEVELRGATAAPAAVDPAFDDNSDIVIPAPKPRKKTAAELLAEQMMKRYQGVRIGGLNQVAAATQAPASQAVVDPKPVEKNLNDTLLHAEEQKPKLKTPGLAKDLSQHLARYQNQFQGCYDRALLSDESLNGRIQFEMQIGSAGGIAADQVLFQGVGLPATKTQVQNCLQTVLHGIRFPPTLAQFYGRTIKFQAVLSL